MTMNKKIFTTGIMIGILIGIGLGCAYGDYYIKVNDMQNRDDGISQANCIEYVTVDNDSECSIFIFQGATYATEFAPIVNQ